MAVAEEASAVNLTEGALPPAWMNTPSRASSDDAAAAPTATAGVHCAPTLLEAPRRPAASHLCVRITERPDSVDRAEGLAPCVERGSLQCCVILPTYLGRRWVRLLLFAGHFFEGAQGVESGRFIREDICELFPSRLLLSDLIELPTTPAASARMHCGAAHVVAPTSSAASHSGEAIAERADVVHPTESSTPVLERRVQLSVIVPTLHGWLGVFLLLRARLLHQGICRRIVGLVLLGDLV